MIKNTADPGEEAKNAFMRIHFAKIKHNKGNKLKKLTKIGKLILELNVQ